MLERHVLICCALSHPTKQRALWGTKSQLVLLFSYKTMKLWMVICWNILYVCVCACFSLNSATSISTENLNRSKNMCLCLQVLHGWGTVLEVLQLHRAALLLRRPGVRAGHQFHDCERVGLPAWGRQAAHVGDGHHRFPKAHYKRVWVKLKTHNPDLFYPP